MTAAGLAVKPFVYAFVEKPLLVLLIASVPTALAYLVALRLAFPAVVHELWRMVASRRAPGGLCREETKKVAQGVADETS